MLKSTTKNNRIFKIIDLPITGHKARKTLINSNCPSNQLPPLNSITACLLTQTTSTYSIGRACLLTPIFRLSFRTPLLAIVQDHVPLFNCWRKTSFKPFVGFNSRRWEAFLERCTVFWKGFNLPFYRKNLKSVYLEGTRCNK